MAKRIKPISRIVKLEAEINKIIGEAFSPQMKLPGVDECWVPCVDISEKEDTIIVQVELPGVSEKDITILLHSNHFEIKGNKKEDLQAGELRFFRLEREYGKFRRVVFLPSSVVTENAQAILENGILTLELHKYRPRKGKEVVLKVHKSGEK